MKIVLLFVITFILIGGAGLNVEAKNKVSRRTVQRSNKNISRRTVQRSNKNISRRTVEHGNSNVNMSNKYYHGTCTELKRRGLGNFSRDSINYSIKRDRDNDGLACELR